jgi:hypothetical protein
MAPENTQLNDSGVAFRQSWKQLCAKYGTLLRVSRENPSMEAYAAAFQRPTLAESSDRLTMSPVSSVSVAN